MTMVFILLLFIFVILVCCLISHRFSYFSRRSIPSPPLSSLIFGHLSKLWSAHSYSDQLRTWTGQFGSVYGLFEGLRPLYVISDIDFVQEVFVSQFTRFCGRRTPLLARVLGNERLHVLAANSAGLWKRHRTVLNPTFTGSKLRRLIPTVESCLDAFMEKLAAATTVTSSINICEMYERLTMDVICRCAFGIDTQVQNDPNNTNIYLQKTKELFAVDFERTSLAKLHRIMPTTQLANLCSYMFRFKRWTTSEKTSTPAGLWLIEHMHQFVQSRFTEVNNNKPVVDLLQLMIDSVHSDKAQLSPPELFSNAFVILAAGFETTATALGYCTYRLAAHPDIQEQLNEEILEHWSPDIDYYDLVMSKLTNLDLFVREVLRMHPIAIQIVNRQCMEDTHIAGYHIEKGSLIQVDVLSIHFDPQLWGPEPVDEFHPERHSQKRHPLAYMPFGAGPRLCLGMRFALMEIKLCLARLIKEYSILPSSDEEYKFRTSEKIVIAPEKVYVKIAKRSA